MSVFQKSVINKYLKTLDSSKLESAYECYAGSFTPEKISLIRNMKEEEYQDGFLRDLFVNVLGYTLKPDTDFNLVREKKNQQDAKKADGAVIKDGKVIAVIELKDTKTKDMGSVTDQAFGYKNSHEGCKFVITSNFHRLRFYIDNKVEFEQFDLFDLTREQFSLLYLILSKDSVFSDIPSKLKTETKFHEERVSKSLYDDYSAFKKKLFGDMAAKNPGHDKLTLFKKSQKLIDRFLFILFAEDRGLLPPNSISRIISRFDILKSEDAYRPLYDICRQYFGYLDAGNEKEGIPAYNGGLFYPDEILDCLKIDDGILREHLYRLSVYDFDTEIDVNILGHIFEHSLSEIEELTAELEGTKSDRSKSRRKKDGVYYTPKYITQYIVENTVGTLCTEKRKELGISEIEFDEKAYRRPNGFLTDKGKELFNRLEEYKKWLLTLKIVDPACGSGAFLNQALNFLIQEHKTIDDIIAELTASPLRLFDTDKAILENNLYGVDINDESIEIAKLSLWLHTARKDRKLSDLNNNIKCGNSLIDDPKVAGDKAFDWNKEFPQIFGKPKEQKPQVIEKKPDIDYAKLIREKSIEIQKETEKAYAAAKAAKEISKQVYEYSQKLSQVNEPVAVYNDNTGFDVVIGNPPYGAKLPPEHQEYLNLHYIKGGSETAISFLKLSDKILKHKGLLSFIIPKSFSYASNYQPIREYLRNGLNEVVDCKKVWKEVKLEQVIMNYRKNHLSDSYYSAVPNNEIIQRVGTIKKYTFEKYGFFLNNISNIELEIANKLTQSDFYLNDVSENSRGGMFQKFVFENGDFYVIGGAEIQRHGITSIKGKVKAQDIGNDPKSQIRNNSVLVQNIVAHIENPADHIKITACIPDTIEYKILDTINQITINENYSNKFIWVLLNSNLINWFAYRFIFGKAIRTMHFDSPVTSRIPVKKLNQESQEPFIRQADLMLELNKQLQEKTNKFQSRIKSNFALEKISTKLESFYEYDFKTFVAELKKQKVSPTLKQQDEWEEYFNEYKKEINDLQAQIRKTDAEIDQMVYELYGLTEEEIRIVEGSV
ncbi:MAG: N-6 DNA methylase [Candidatus Delongbacteria bacterium]|nr:N-6 DNA methylase [Candidatus Delongbacteria bacterium]